MPRYYALARTSDEWRLVGDDIFSKNLAAYEPIKGGHAFEDRKARVLLIYMVQMSGSQVFKK